MNEITNYAGLFPQLRLALSHNLGRLVTDSEWQYFATEYNERLDAMTETIFQDMIENSDEWLDDDSGAGE